MDNQDKIKYKYTAAPGWIEKIDLVSGSKQSFNVNKSGLVKEMQAWIDAGNEIEPEFTTEELTEKEVANLQLDLESQRSKCTQLLKDSDKKINGDWPYQDDIPAWLAVRQQWRDIIKSGQIEDIPEKPF